MPPPVRRKWEYSRGQLAVTVRKPRDWRDNGYYAVITLIARAKHQYHRHEGHWVRTIGRLTWEKPTHRMSRDVFGKYSVVTEREAIELANEAATRIGAVYVPDIEEGDEILTLEQAVVQGLQTL